MPLLSEVFRVFWPVGGGGGQSQACSIDLEQGRTAATTATDTPPPPNTFIEGYSWGYPQYSAFISSVDSFYVFRRFKRVRARMLLRKQDRVSALEERLDAIDRDQSSVFLGHTRGVDNQDVARAAVFRELDEALADYDRFMDATSRALSFKDADRGDISSLRAWLNNNGSIAKEETTYIQKERDLLTISPLTDSALFQFEAWVEKRLAQYEFFRRLPSHDISSSPEVIIYTGSMIKRIAKALIISLITLLLLLPIIVCNVITDAVVRIVIVMAATVFYLIVLSDLTKAKTMELVIAATTQVLYIAFPSPRLG